MRPTIRRGIALTSLGIIGGAAYVGATNVEPEYTAEQPSLRFYVQRIDEKQYTVQQIDSLFSDSAIRVGLEGLCALLLASRHKRT